MEISKTQIARLVLGYLKSEKCTSAFNEFLINSQYLKSHAVFVKNGKYFATRVGGLTLEDIISEYSEISLTIQGKLEQTDYYDNNLKMKLSEQLLYILDHHSRSPSPMLPRDLNATPIESLPGNSTHNSHNLSNESSVDTQRSSYMEYPKSSITSAGLSQKDDRKTSLSELDNQIRSIKQNSEKDPAFDKLLEEIIGQKNDTAAEVPTSKNFSDRSLSNYNQAMSVNESSTSRLNMQNSEYYGNKEASQTVSITKNCNISTTDSLFSKPPANLQPPNPQQNQLFLTNTGLYILVNSSQPPATTVNSALTETDIMKMPTLILDDPQPSILPAPQPQMKVQQSQISTDQQQMLVTQSQIIMAPQKSITSSTISTNKTTTVQSETKKKKLKTLAPKVTDSIAISSIDGEYFEVYSNHPDNSQSSAKTQEEEKPCGRPGLRKRPARLSKAAKTCTPPPGDVKTASPSKRSLDVLESPQKTEKKKISKSLFKNCGSAKKGDVWDADLRELLILNPVSKKAERRQSTNSKFDVSDDKLDLSDDEELKRDALLIEAAFKTPVKTQQTENSPETERKEKTPKEKCESSVGEKSNSRSEDAENEEDNAQTVLTEETEVHLRNCNGPPRIKKKCNTTSTTELLEVEIIEECTEKTVVQQELKRKTFILETPVKDVHPKTPGKFEITPSFSKALEEHLEGMDLLSFPTPVIPITPNVPMTPNVDLTTPDHSNRPTDYSTSSSYYQPSDTEQNKSLETMMEEYRREEKKGKKQKEEKGNAENDSKTEVKDARMSDMKNIFNKNVIGKKNLNLMKPENSSDSEDAGNSNTSSDSSSSSSQSSSSSDSDSDFDVTLKKPTNSPKSSYSFRKKKATKDEKQTSSPTEIRNENIKCVAEKPKKTWKSSRKAKTPNTILKKPRAKSGKFIKIEAKMSPNPKEQFQEKCDIENEITDDDFALHLSTDEDSVNKVNNDTTTNKNKEVNLSISQQPTNESKEDNTFTSQQPTTETAKQLIQDLYDRGIHLLPKDPLNQSSDGAKKTDSESEFNSNALENLDVSSDENSSSETKKEEASESSSIQNPADVTFDIKIYDENDVIHHVHDYSKRRKKKIYDLNLLNKKMCANVYIETKDTFVDRIIRTNPEFTTLEYIPKKIPVKRRRKSVKPENETEQKIKQAVQSKTKADIKQNATEEIETEVIIENAPKDTKKNESCESKIENSLENNETMEPDSQKKFHAKRSRRTSTNRSIEAPNCGAVAIEEASSALDDVETDKNVSKDSEELSAVASGEDDLMNFAVLRNPMEPEKEVPLRRDKRKCSSEGENRPAEKKPKKENEKQALLKKINVDLFLNKVHGDEQP